MSQRARSIRQDRPPALSRKRGPRPRGRETPLTALSDGPLVNLVNNVFEGLQVADDVFAAIRAERFYVLTHADMQPLIQQRLDGVGSGSNPAPFTFPGVLEE